LVFSEKIDAKELIRMSQIRLLLFIIFVFFNATIALAENNAPKDINFHFFIHPIAGPEEADIELFLINEGDQSLEFEAPTSQWYEISIFNSKNELVYQYSRGRSFLQAFQKLVLKPGEKKVWVESIYKNKEEKLAEGTYKVQAILKAVTLNGEDIANYHILKDEATLVIPPANPIIELVKMDKNEKNIVVSGKARPESGRLYYVVEDGHHEWIPETKIKGDFSSNDWKEFSFDLKMPPVKKQDAIPLILYIYERDEHGVMKHSYPKLIRTTY
jgi:hypothetical protein